MIPGGTLQCGMRVRAATALLAFAVVDAGARQRAAAFVPVGIVVDSSADWGHYELSELRKLGFTVLADRDPGVPARIRIHALPAREAPPGAALTPIAPSGIEIVRVPADASAARVRQDAWILLGQGVRGVLFDGWATLQLKPDALRAAADFADVVTRNAALFGPLAASTREVRTSPGSPDLFARFVESQDAIVLVSANRSGSEQRVTLSFTSETPEAIWQNMESGAAVNFVAGPDGPTYTRTFPSHDVVVLMIRKKYR
jgi:hypothetical protein